MEDCLCKLLLELDLADKGVYKRNLVLKSWDSLYKLRRIAYPECFNYD